MNITVLAVGTKMPRWVDEAVNEYAKRFGRDIQYALKEIKPEKRGAGVNARIWWCWTNAAKRRLRSNWRHI